MWASGSTLGGGESMDQLECRYCPLCHAIRPYRWGRQAHYSAFVAGLQAHIYSLDGYAVGPLTTQGAVAQLQRSDDSGLDRYEPVPSNAGSTKTPVSAGAIGF